MRHYLKNIFTLIACVMILLVLASCHEHTFSTEWNYDDTYHWHDATCGHAVQYGNAKHILKEINRVTDDNGNSTVTYQCSVCKVEIEEKTHDHVYSSQWSYDDTNHWHDATCGHSETSSTAKHTLEKVGTSNDGLGNTTDYYVCSVCNYSTEKVTHDHVYSSQWSYDDTNHWHDATCGHSETSSTAKHTLEKVGTSNDGLGNTTDYYVCSVCNYSTEKVTHEHVFSEDWTSNDTSHWHATICGHTEKTGEGDHTWRETGKKEQESGDTIFYYECSVCGYKKESNISCYASLKKLETPVFEVCHSDGEYSHYTFLMGTISHVPMQTDSEIDSNSKFYYEGLFDKYTLSISHASYESFKSCMNEVQDICSFNASSIEVNADFDYRFMRFDADLSVEANYMHTQYMESNYHYDYSSEIEKINSNSSTATIELNLASGNYMKGYYRYILEGVLDVYVDMIVNNTTGDVYYEFYTELKSTTPRLEFSLDGRFDVLKNVDVDFDLPNPLEYNLDEISATFTFDCQGYDDVGVMYVKKDVTATLPTPTRTYTSGQDVYEFAGWEYKDTSYTSYQSTGKDVAFTAKWEQVKYNYANYAQKRIELFGYSSYGGLANDNNSYDTLDLSSLEQYLTSDYIIMFNVKVNIAEVDDGYQEIYIYRNNVIQSKDDINNQRNNNGDGWWKNDESCGCVAYNDNIEHGSGSIDASAYDHVFAWLVSGEQCDTEMYIKYDVHGKKIVDWLGITIPKDHDWYKNNVRVEITVIKK